MNFRLNESDHEYPVAQLLIFAEYNYVGVYYRESLRDACGPEDDGDDRYTKWRRLSYHDSCWRDDGVDRFLSRFGPRINTLDWHDGICNNKWYSLRPVSDDQATALRNVPKDWE